MAFRRGVILFLGYHRTGAAPRLGRTGVGQQHGVRAPSSAPITRPDTVPARRGASGGPGGLHPAGGGVDEFRDYRLVDGRR